MKRTRYLMAAAIFLAAASPANATTTKDKMTFEGPVNFTNTVSLKGIPYITPSADGTAGYQLTTNGSGTLSWAAAGGTMAWDDLTSPDANKTHAFTTFTSLFTGTSTVADQWNFQGLGAFGDISVMRVEQITGNPTNGTVLEVVAEDANVDPLVVSASGKANAFVVGQNTGVVTVAGVAEGTTAVSVTAGDVNLTDGDVVLQSGDIGVTGNLVISGTASIGTILMDGVTAATGGATLALNGDGAGGINIGATSTGGITFSRATTVADTRDLTIGEGVLTVDNDQVNETALVITSDATTTGGGLGITSAVTTTSGKAISVVANDVTTGDLLYLESSAAGLTTGNFINAYNGAATVFEVGLYGATTIAGNAATDILTITAGNLQMTNGDVDMDEGKLEIDTTTNESSYIKRNQATTTTPVLELEETDASGDNPILLIDQNATAAGSYGMEIDSAGGTAVLVSAEATTGDGLEFSTPASYTGQLIKVNDTLVGTNGEGIIDIKTTANMATGSTLVRLDADTGTLAAATDGFLLSADDDTVVQATSYAIKIDSANNEALHVATGKALFDEQPTFTGGIDADGDVDIDLSANTEEVSIETTAVDFAAGAGLVTVHGDHAGNTNDAALVRLVYQANGDAQDTFILCEDNSTGAAANGDDQFKVGTNGDTTMAGILTVGSRIINTPMALAVTTEANITNPITSNIVLITGDNDADNDTIDLQNGTTAGQTVVLIAEAAVDADDTMTINYGDTTCTNCPATAFDKIGESATLTWTGTTWVVTSLQTSL